MMKNFMTSRVSSRGRRPESDLDGKSTTHILREVEVMAIFS
jgi:hypothetical protein